MPRHSTPRKILLGLMALSALWETVITVLIFAFPEFEARQWNAQLTPETLFSGNIIGGFLILFSALCWVSTLELFRGDRHGELLARLIGIFWVYMGIGLYLHPTAPRFVILDTVRGAAILLLLWLEPKGEIAIELGTA